MEDDELGRNDLKVDIMVHILGYSSAICVSTKVLKKPAIGNASARTAPRKPCSI